VSVSIQEPKAEAPSEVEAEVVLLRQSGLVVSFPKWSGHLHMSMQALSPSEEAEAMAAVVHPDPMAMG
jgi:hypothetical protein